MKLIVGINLGNIGKTDAVGKNDNIMIYTHLQIKVLKNPGTNVFGLFYFTIYNNRCKTNSK